MKTATLLLSSLFFLPNISAATLHIGVGHPYATFEQAAAVAVAGDTLLFHGGIHL